MANRYKVPQRQWRKWNDQARGVFNEVFYTMTRNQHLFLHPGTEKQPKKVWNTTAWNAAWIAADAVKR